MLKKSTLCEPWWLGGLVAWWLGGLVAWWLGGYSLFKVPHSYKIIVKRSRPAWSAAEDVNNAQKPRQDVDAGCSGFRQIIF